MRRVANDGLPYAYGDFIDHYGKRRGNEMWEAANDYEEPGVVAGSSGGGQANSTEVAAEEPGVPSSSGCGRALVGSSAEVDGGPAQMYGLVCPRSASATYRAARRWQKRIFNTSH